MYQEFTGVGQNYLINVSLIIYVIDKKNIRVIITAFDKIEVIDTIQEIKDKITRYYLRTYKAINN